MIVPFLGGVFSAIVRQAEQTAARQDYNIILITTGATLEREQNAVDMLLRRRVEGVIAVPYGPRQDLTCPHITRLIENGIPVILAEQDMPGAEFPKVVIDNRDGAPQIDVPSAAPGTPQYPAGRPQYGTMEPLRARPHRRLSRRLSSGRVKTSCSTDCTASAIDQYRAG